MEEHSHQLRCIGCGQATAPAELRKDFRCARCGELLAVEYPSWSLAWDRSWNDSGSDSGSGEQPKRAQSFAQGAPNAGALRWLWRERKLSNLAVDGSGVWRFRELMPILRRPEEAVTLAEGNTPIYRMRQCGKDLGMPELYAKHQGMNPTGSFKDVGMTAALSQAREQGYGWVACASTGNTSASMAAYAACAGMQSLVLLPQGKISWPKLSQAIDYGAITCQLDTDFDGCVRVLTELMDRAPIYLLNSVNPYRLEGQKTPAFEIAEAWDWAVPDHLIVPGGNLANGAALAKGFLEMKHLGLTSSMPKVSVIQAEGANPLYLSLLHSNGLSLHPVKAETRATAIRIGNPASWRKAVRAIQETGGFCEQVSEVEIAIAKAQIGREGIGCEPASAVTLAGLKKLLAQGRIERQESVLLMLTGHTLKDSGYTIDFHQGSLLRADELRGHEREVERNRRTVISLEASTDAVLRLLEESVHA